MNRKNNVASEAIQALPVLPGKPGVIKTEGGYQFTFAIPEGKEDTVLLLYQKGEKKPWGEISMDGQKRIGSMASVLVRGISPDSCEYNYRIGDKVRQDPYASYLTGTDCFGSTEWREDPHHIRCGFKSEVYRWNDESFKPRKLSETILYKIQVRSFTMHKNSGVRAKGTFKGVEQKIPYLKELGITAVLFMPVYEYREILPEMRRDIPKSISKDMGGSPETKRVNVWGYTGEACYFAPKASFASGGKPVKEFRHMVDRMHQAGIECLMEFYFDGTVCPSMMLDVLHYWKREYHIDGFRLMGSGVCQELFVKDPLLSDAKLLFSQVDGNALYGDKKPYRRNVAEYNEGFLYCMRHLLKGDENMIGEFIFRNRRNPRENGVINYFADQDGFTMMDMVSYEEKHNEENGENNMDGLDYNCSWNCGVEGTTRKKSIRELRMRQLENAFFMLMLSQGTPMIFQGDEFGNSQNGNNNAWCQDNAIGWVDWNSYRSNKKLFSFVKNAIALRNRYPVLHMEEELKGADYKALGYPDISCHGTQAWYVPGERNLRHIGLMYCGDYVGCENELLYVAYNLHWISHEFALPNLPKGGVWKPVEVINEPNGETANEKDMAAEKKNMVEIPARTIAILIGKQEK